MSNTNLSTISNTNSSSNVNIGPLSQYSGSTEGLASGLPLASGRNSVSISGNTVVPNMDDILDKLNCLDYVKQFIRPNNIIPFHRFYFTAPAVNSNEQFYRFVLLTSWLLKVSNHAFEPAGQFDDPNAVSANIAAELKKAGIQFDYPPTKLKQGYGEAVLFSLQSLVDMAMVSTKFVFQKPIHKIDDYPEEAEVDVDAEVTTEDVEDNTPEVEEDEEMYMGAMQSEKVSSDTKSLAPTSIKIDPSEWKLEVERVTPMLKVQIPNDNKDWRVHIEQINHHQKTIQTCMTDTHVQLAKLHSEIEKTLEKIVSREKYINTQFESQIDQYRTLQDQSSDVRQKYNVLSSNVSELTNELSRISEELDSVKSRMDDLGNGMTDSKPLVGIKQGLARLKTETKQMDLRIGVIEHTLLHAKLKNKGPIGPDANSFSAQVLSFFNL
ncbi:hypothetical protein BATDEDRAFT_33198 [Batrachochytrium dendrobatidis JAM81]|uniref:Intraflagellar transport protein 57 n=1 Tax=Batrachochytrium dendrobatidis (strain JAM81 / FGSC 10211) TaxID=684364 RepID=F4P1Z5_BATDJ|nr:uncharacterized protein BATDEDRAFT_33198 [Batrachochytrium dendrobatidis JAM81]EGF81022.1 hypothetical protein BATDEDRAFT_33198 [Batrachochytrium dendrobatidis JAM81]KAJ8329014.1 hypothetical protein O5D80_002972 [Batrachochytrium dendrobatidis]KAK5668966.1 hypothetical protein QVD99_004737 [Batrachochytrium dendrobatidis]|eukprot:XP_006678562.1 hypothetical protein BATDEDRAFT_33198 [Batrachochytrium dendrobatidis JAM81]